MTDSERARTLGISRQRVWQMKQRALNRCVVCGDAVDKTISSTYCPGCAVKKREVMRARMNMTTRYLGSASYRGEIRLRETKKR